MKYYPLLLIVILLGCRKLITDEFDNINPEPVVNCILKAGDSINLHLSYSQGIGKEPIETIDDAIIYLYENDSLIDTILSYNNYTSKHIAEAYKTYRFTTDSTLEISSSCILPKAKKIIQITHIDFAGKDPEGLDYPAIEITFENTPQQTSYYEIVLRLHEETWIPYGNNRDIDTYSPQLLNVNDPILLTEGIPIPVFSNKMIKDSLYTLRLNYTTGSASSNGDGYKMNLYPFSVELRTVSEDYYHYMKQLYIYEQGRYPDIFGDAARTYPLYSNISNGLGIFAGYSSVFSDTIIPESISW